MKKSIVFFFLLFCLSGFAQESANSLIDEGIAEISTNNFTKAIKLFNESAILAKDAGDKPLQAKAQIHLADAFFKAGDAAKSLKIYFQVLPLLKSIHDYTGVAKVSKSIGLVYAQQKKLNKSIEYLTAAASQAKLNNDEMLIAECLSLAGPVYEQRNDLVKALDAYSQALAIYRARGRELDAGLMLSEMGNAYKLQSDYVQSILNYKEALGYFNSAGDRRKVAGVLSKLGHVLSLIEDHNESLRLYEQAYLDAVAIKYHEVIIESSLGMAIAYENLKQYPESIRYHKLHEQKKDSFVSASHAKELAELEMKYGRHKAVVLPEENANPEIVQSAGIGFNIYIIIAFGIFALLITVGFLWRKKLFVIVREESMFKGAEGRERLKLVQDINSNLGLKLSTIKELSDDIVERSMGMPTIKSKGEALQETTKKIEESVRDLVWLLTPKTTTLSSYVDSIAEHVSGYFDNTPVEVLLSRQEGKSASIIARDSQRELLVVVNECLSDIAKDPQATKVLFGITYTGTRLMISIKDNGMGNDKSEEDKKRLGSHIASIGGIMRIDSEAGWGSKVKIVIPLHKPTKSRKR